MPIFLKTLLGSVQAAAIPRSTLPPTQPCREERRPAAAARGRLSLYRYLISSMIVRSRGLNHICSVLTVDVAIVTQARRLAIDRVGEGTDLHGLRQALSDSEPGSCAAAAGGALLHPGRTSMLADDFRSLSEKVILCEDGAGAGSVAVARPERGSTSTI